MTKQDIIDTLRITLAIAILIGLLVIIGAAVAFSIPTHTFANDHFTVANSTDGEQVIVTFEVTFEHFGEMDTADRKRAMHDMALAQSCTNQKLDNYIESHTKQKVRGADLREVTVGCEDRDISIERVVVSNAPA